MSARSIQVRLQQIRWEAQGIASYEFVPAGNESLPAFTAGAHIDLSLPQGLTRSYSLTNAPSDPDRYVIAVQREAGGRGGSSWMHTVPRVGDVLRVGAPGNDFELAEGAQESVFIAGGIGITPVMAMTRRLHALGRSWRLHYAARSPGEAAFMRELESMQSASTAVEFCFRSSRASRMNIGRIVGDAPAGAHLYCCGPGRMIDEFLSACSQRPAAFVHCERFSSSSPADTAGGFEVLLQRSGQRIAVPAGKTILDTLLDHSVAVQYACCAGVCGTCLTPVVEGLPDHRDDYLTAQEKLENRSIMICCSGSRTQTLVLDL